MAISTGIQAPDFTLKTKTAEGLKDIKLSDNYGKSATGFVVFSIRIYGCLHC